MISWRSDAHKGRTQTQLNNDYSTVTEKYRTGQNKNKSNKRPATLDASGDGRSSTGNADADGDSNTGSGGGEYRKRVCLQKGRRVITERPA